MSRSSQGITSHGTAQPSRLQEHHVAESMWGHTKSCFSIPHCTDSIAVHVSIFFLFLMLGLGAMTAMKSDYFQRPEKILWGNTDLHLLFLFSSFFLTGSSYIGWKLKITVSGTLTQEKWCPTLFPVTFLIGLKGESQLALGKQEFSPISEILTESEDKEYGEGRCSGIARSQPDPMVELQARRCS